jgi:hypothetical protein
LILTETQTTKDVLNAGLSGRSNPDRWPTEEAKSAAAFGEYPHDFLEKLVKIGPKPDLRLGWQ